MNIAYFRNSKFARTETVARLKQAAEAAGFSVIGEAALPKGEASVLSICRPEWAEQVIDADRNLLGLLPCSVSVIERGGETVVGAATPTLLGSVAPSEDIRTLASEAEKALRALVEAAAGVEPLRAQALKLYSSHSCPYCNMEKAWLEKMKATFEVIYVDDDQKAAEDLVRRTGQMGVPVTEVIYEQGASEFIVGFDRPKLEPIVAAM